MATIGPGAQQDEQVAPDPKLQGASEFEYVTVFNPMSADFAARVGQDVAVDVPFEIQQDKSGQTQALTKTEGDASQRYGLSLKNPDFKGRRHVHRDLIIPAGGSLNLRGNDAQVVVRQLVNEILQRQGEQRFIADPVKRREIEDSVILERGSIEDIMAARMQTPQQQANAAIDASNNRGENNEQPFAGVAEQPTGEATERDKNTGGKERTPNQQSPSQANQAA